MEEEKQAVTDRASRLEKLRDIVLTCRQCPLYESRHKMVFGDGDPDAWLMFIGEAPGREEDQTGTPFIGRSGQLLRKMLAAIGLTREDWYIANIIKDRPPGNRVPEPEEISNCIKFLHKQIEIINPEIIVLLGKTAVKGMLPDRSAARIDDLRRECKDLKSLLYNDIPVLVTYHPSALLRDPSKKNLAAVDFRFMEGLRLEFQEARALPYG